MSNLSVNTIIAHGQEEIITSDRSEIDENDDDDATLVDESSNEEEEEYLTSPSIPNENIDFELVYALHKFQATVEGQISVERDDKLKLLDDSNSYWWLVKVLRCDAVGYIPAESIETPYERLARLNRHRNINFASSGNNKEEDYLRREHKGQVKIVSFTSPLHVVAEEHSDYLEDIDDESYEEYEGDDELLEDDTEPTTDPALQNEKVEDTGINGLQENSDTNKNAPKSEVLDDENQQQNNEEDLLRHDQASQHQLGQPAHKQNSEPAIGRMKQNVYTNEQNHSASSVPSDITKIINQPGETIKTSLTPALGSDFMDFSDDEERQSNAKTNKPFGNDPTKTKISFDELIKNDEKDEKKGGKSKKEEKKKEGGRFMNFFKRKSKKKEEEPPKQFSKTTGNSNYNNRVKPANIQYQQMDSQSSPRQGSLTDQQRIQVQVDLHSQRDQGQQSQMQQQGQQKMQALTRPPLQQKSQLRPQSPQQQEKYQEHQQFSNINSQSQQTPATQSNTIYNVFRIFAGKNIMASEEFKVVLLSPTISVKDLIKKTLIRFKLDSEENWADYYITVKEINGDQVRLSPHDHPLEIYDSLITSSVPLPTVRRESISSISSTFSNLSGHDVIKALDLQNESQNSACFFLNKKSKRGSRSSEERKIRVRVLVYADDLPVRLRSKSLQIPRTSMSVPKHLAEKASRRRSREEGKPKEKSVIVNTNATVINVIEKAMNKFGITEGIADDGRVSDAGSEKLIYHLTMIVDGEEKALSPETFVTSVFPSQNIHHLSVDSLESSLSLECHSDEPIFVLRLLRSEDLQSRASEVELKRITQGAFQSMLHKRMSNQNPMQSNTNFSSRKELIEQQREYSRARQNSIITTHKNNSQGVDIVTSMGAIRSSRVFGSKVRYSFISKTGEEIDISDLIEDIWSDDEIKIEDIDSMSINRSSIDSLRNSNGYRAFSPTTNNKRKSTTQDVDVLGKIIDETQNDGITLEERIDRVFRKVRAGQYGTNATSNFASSPRNQKTTSSQGQVQEPYKTHGSIASPPLSPKSQNRAGSISNSRSESKSIEAIPEDSELSLLNIKNSLEEIQSQSSLHSLPVIPQTRKRSSSATSNSSIKSNNSVQSLNAMSMSNSSAHRKSSVSTTDNSWILSDSLGLQELLILVRSEVNMIDIKERRKSEWQFDNDSEMVLTMFRTMEIKDEIKEVYESVNNELEELEQ
ncbi:12365_t:CDS:2, partial [Acaulospora colombiana]